MANREANIIFEWIEYWYNPKRRHSSIGMHNPVTFETSTPSQTKIADPTPEVSVLRGNLTRRLNRLYRHDPSEIDLTDLAQCGGGQLLHRNLVDMLQRC